VLEIYFSDVIATDLDVSVLLMALFSVLELETVFLEVFWIYDKEEKDSMAAWTKALPRLRFKTISGLLKDISSRNIIDIPMIGSIKCKSGKNVVFSLYSCP
jgi:hypothetical protein